jgi:ribosome-associated translation inhibitor RaiA
MNNPVLQAFFIGRALAESISEEVEKNITNLLSEVGKFDAEQRENLRQFADRVVERAHQEAEASLEGTSNSTILQTDGSAGDLQANIDELRAEMAQLRTELQNYRARSS